MTPSQHQRAAPIPRGCPWYDAGSCSCYSMNLVAETSPTQPFVWMVLANSRR